MNITLPREIFYPALQQVAGAIERRQTLPILGNFMIEAKDNNLRIKATDLEIELVNNVSIESISEEGATTIPARKLIDICKTLPDGCDINLRTDGDQAIIQAERSRFSLSTLPAADFPSIEDLRDAKQLRVRQSVLKKLIQNVSFAMAQQDVRYYLNGMLVEISKDVIRGATTDGHRLALCEAPLDNSFDEERQIIVPRKGILEMQRLLADDDMDANIEIDSNHIRVEIKNLRFTSKLIDGKFPDYKRVIPANNDKFLKVNRDSLRQALTRSAIISNEKFKGAKFNISEEFLSIETQNPEREKSKEELIVDYKGDELSIGFNISYILDIINNVNDEFITLEMRTADSSGVIRHHGGDGMECTFVVMPMRI